MRPRGRTRARVASAFALAALLAAPGVAHAATADADPNVLTLSDFTQQLAPGISLHSFETLQPSGWIKAKVLTADLTKSNVHSNMLMAGGGVVAAAAPLTQTANQAGALAAVNGDFFNIGDTNATSGWEMQGDNVLKSSNQVGSRTTVGGIGDEGLGYLANLTLQAKAGFLGSDHTIAAVNSPSPKTNTIDLFTSDWGSYTRDSGSFRTGTPEIEVHVSDGHVVSKASVPASEPLAKGDYAMLAIGKTAVTTLDALQVGDAVDITYGATSNIAEKLRYAIGGAVQLIRDGVVPAAVHYDSPGDEADVAGRPALAFKDGGRTMMLIVTDGRQTDVHGFNATDFANFVKSLGADNALLFDGGGSAEMVARAPGDQNVSVLNTPSDGAERPVPNGVGVFSDPGDGTIHRLIVNANGDDPTTTGVGARVFPGLHRTLTVKAEDNQDAPVAVQPSAVRWSTDTGAIDNGQLAAPANATGTIDVHATTDTASQETSVRVLRPLHSLELSAPRLSFSTATASAAQTLAVTGRDDQGYATPIELEDMQLGYDHSLIEVTPDPRGLKITPLAAGGTDLTVRVGGQTEVTAVSVGVQTQDVYDFDDNGAGTRWRANGTDNTTQVLTNSPDGLTVTYPAMRNMGVTASSIVGREVQLPDQPLNIDIRIKASQATSLSYLGFWDAAGKSYGVYGSPMSTSTDWQTLRFAVPAGVAFPLSMNSFQLIETDLSRQVAGSFTLGGITVENASPVDVPGLDPLRADSLVSPDGRLPTGGRDWRFASLSDIQFTADSPELTKVGVAALERIRRTNPDLIVLNGDVTDRGLPQDMTLARQTLEAGGCQLIPLSSTIGTDNTPAPTADKTPCYYVPGNHESYGLNNVQADLRPFTAEFGQPYGTFDHNGTRFILLASSLGSLHATNWDQLPMFQQALTEAENDSSIKNVVVFAHHPVDDPLETKASQLGDRTEVALIERMLTDFRAASGKGVDMVGSHAQIANVHRIEGVPYTVMPSSGKDPYGTPDRGGFTGWLDWGVDPSKDAGQQWVTADVRAFAQSITLNTPAALQVSETAPLSGSIVQPEGVSTGTRVVPLRYPMSIHWGGDDGLAIGSGKAAVDAARAAGKIAILDPVTEQITGLHTGSVAVSVTNDSMREYTDDASLAPITTQKTIQVTAYTGSGPRLEVATPVFPDQPANTIGQGQRVTVTNGGDQPLSISDVEIQDVDGQSDGDFILSDQSCTKGEIAPGATCSVLVRFAPARLNATSLEKLVFTDNTVDGSHSVQLLGRSTDLPRGDQGEQGGEGPQGPVGPPGRDGEDGRDGATGPAGPAGQDGATGPAGANGTNGTDGRDGATGPAGTNGTDGREGATGPAGADGTNGTDGRDGATGPAGPAGPRGARGPAGPAAAITCTVKNRSGSNVVCKVVFVGRDAKAASNKAKAKQLKARSARLVRGKRTFATGKVGQLRSVRRVTKGHYTLRVRTSAKQVAAYKVTIK
ncbi:MAG TPA: phosphodiester glycosidase family protein [Conexibacter sp.]